LGAWGTNIISAYKKLFRAGPAISHPIGKKHVVVHCLGTTRLSTKSGQNGHNFCKNGVTAMFEVAKWIVWVVPGQF
jgi:hypothetical protein